MPKLKIDGVGTVQVDDAFLQMPRDQQDAFVSHVADQAKAGRTAGGGETIGAAPKPAATPAAADTSWPDPNDTSTAAYGPDGRLRDAPTMAQLGKGIDNTVGAIAGGIPFSDRISAAGAALTGLGGHFGDYSGALADIRGIDAARKKADPAGEVVGNVTGGLLTALATGPVSMAARLPQGAGLLGKLAAYGTDGAVFGGLQGASEAPDLRDAGDVSTRAAHGAALGGALGVGVPLAGAGAVAAIKAASPFVSKPIEGMGRITTGLLGNLMNPRAMAEIDRLGPDAAPIDASPSLLGLGQGVAAKPGPGADRVVDFVNARHAGQSDRLVGDLNANLGPAFSPDAITGLLGAKKDALSPLLAQADAQGVMWNPQLEALAQRPAMLKALRSASDTAANEGRPLPMVSLDEAGRDVSPSARSAYDGYAANARGQIDGAVSSLLGSDGQLARADAIMAHRKAVSDPLYAEFRASTIPTTPELAELLKRPSVRGALPDAERLAQDQGKSIYVKGRDEYDPTYEAPPFGEPPPDVPPADYEAMGKPARPTMPRPQTLQDLVKSLEGVQDPRGDLKAMGLDVIPGLIAKPGKGLGQDAVRQIAAEQGYLGAHIDDAMANTTPNDLINALGEHPVHSVRDADAVHAWDAFDMARAEADQYGNPAARRSRPPTAPLPDFEPGHEPEGPVRQIAPEGWDYVKRAIGDKAGNAKRNGLNDEARVYTGLKHELVSVLDRASPVYAKARQAYAGDSELLEALDAGRAAIGRNVSREQLHREFGSLGTDGERHMYRLGAANGLREMVARGGDSPNLARPLVGNQAMRDKLAVLAPSPEALDRFHQTIADTGRSFTEAQRPDVRGWRYALASLKDQAGKATGDQQSAIGQTHGALLDQLRRIDAFDRAHGGAQAVDHGQQAFDVGRDVLRGGDAAPWPADLARNFDALPLEQQALMRAGARSDVEQRFGQNRNDLSALSRIIGGENDFNRANMQTLFGQDATRSMVDAAEREQIFANSRNAIAAGSRTGPMRTASEMIDAATPDRAPVIPKNATVLGLLGNAGEAALKKGTGLLAALANNRVREELGEALVAEGPRLREIRSGLLSAAPSRRVEAVRGLLTSPSTVPALLGARKRDR